MPESININDIYSPEKPFTPEVAKQIVEHFGLEELDRILMQRLKEDTEKDRCHTISFQ